MDEFTTTSEVEEVREQTSPPASGRATLAPILVVVPSSCGWLDGAVEVERVDLPPLFAGDQFVDLATLEPDATARGAHVQMNPGSGDDVQRRRVEWALHEKLLSSGLFTVRRSSRPLGAGPPVREDVVTTGLVGYSPSLVIKD
jgi:hypothetical protein